ncbi:ParA family protein [Marinibactrum halimedae]|uniref:Cobyric acid synthase n=1 Tax=Marinibactrum halimedae TaxID=1444977 RepID=A0AA37T1X7_9GAMM|nr:ParA family protein [Marinibactrum halimedae]MCD9459578.1 ParA family protein [Marinibactrum halimedae]GLS25605.1 cobyric acid synthase [Marinibactrum halimedae]
MIRAIFNRKGGVGKSTITCNLAAVAAHSGKKTIVVDLDPQGNSTSYLGHDGNDDIVGMSEFFSSQISYCFRDFEPDDYVRKTDFEKLFLISASSELIDLESKLSARHKIYKLREFLHKLTPIYDEIYLDTPPVLNFYSLSALIACDACLIPFDCDVFSRDALFDLIKNIEEVKEDHNDNLQVEGIIINHFNAQARLPSESVEELANAGLPILTPYISTSVKIRESHRDHTPMIFMAPKHKVSLEFLSLYQRISGMKEEDIGIPPTDEKISEGAKVEHERNIEIASV